MHKANITDVVLAITYRCNSRCRMCNIWQKQDHDGEIKDSDLAGLPRNLTDINLTGGEPFLRQDLFELVKEIIGRCPKAKLIISSNGFATDLIIGQLGKLLKICPQIGIAISLDGIGETHDRIRGIEHGFKKAMATISAIKALGVKNLKIAFTQGDYNIGELKKVYDLSRDLGLEFSLALVHSSDNYFGAYNKIEHRTEIISEFDRLSKEQLAGWSPKLWARAYFTDGLITLLKTGKRPLPDYSGVANIFIDPSGRIFPCDVAVEPIGWLSPWRLERKDGDSCAHSWMICTARPAMKRHLSRVGWWILKNKLTLLIDGSKRSV